MLENIVKSCPLFVKESGKVILNPHVESNQQQNLIITRGSPLAHAYQVNAFVSYLAVRHTDTHW